MSSKRVVKVKKYLSRITVVAIALAMATTFTFAESQETVSDDEANHKDNTDSRVYEKMIAHGGGSVKGFDTSSSVDAVTLAIENGFKLIELDMEFSADNKIIMLHDWDRTLLTYLGRKYDEKLSLEEFNKQLICGKFKPLTFDKLTTILDENPDVRIVTDTKSGNIKLLTQIAEKYPKYINRMIPQIYEYDEFQQVSDLGYKDIIFTLYTQNTIDYNQLLSFVKDNDIYAVTIGKDYWIKGLPKKLARDGVIVYTHPISTVEEAKEEFAKGAYGVYSSTLTPKELEGYAAEYYLMQKNEKGKKVKLTDETINLKDIRKIKVHGNMDYKAFKYRLDGKVLEAALEEIEDSPSEKHNLSIELWDITEKASPDQQPLYTMEYILTKNGDKVRVLDKKYEYRLEPLKKLPVFEEVVNEENNVGKKPIARENIDILEESFIAKAGEYYYYNSGASYSFSVGEEILLPQKTRNGNVLVPLAETIMALGADKITMDGSRYVYITMGDTKFISQTYSNYIRKNAFNMKVAEPLELHRNKVMVAGEFLEIVTERKYLQGEDVFIVLPKDANITSEQEGELLKTAELLYIH